MRILGCMSLLSLLLATAFANTGKTVIAADEPGKVIVLGREAKLISPAGWKQKTPRSRIIAYEFAAPAAKGDEIDGRMTIMAAGGSIKQNIERWYGQFTQPDGKPTKDRARVEKKKIDGREVHLVDIAGTYKDRPGPFAGAGVDRENYRMLAAIIVTGDVNFYVKFYGPQKTVSQQREAFLTMLDGMQRP